MGNLLFSKKDPLVEIKKTDNQIFNFLNNESVYFFKKNKIYRKSILNKTNVNFPDGSFIASRLKVPQRRGPSFTKDFLLSNFSKDKKHFFIGNTSQKELSKITSINLKRIHVFVPSFIGGFVFSDSEKKEILKQITKFKPNYVWVCIGSPKQEILSNQLFLKYKCTYINIGAGLDFLTKKKKEAPRWVINLKIEWFYRLITDFKKSRKKVYRSIFGLFYLRCISLKD